MADELSEIERRLLRRAGDWGIDGTTGPLLSESAETIGELRRALDRLCQFCESDPGSVFIGNPVKEAHEAMAKLK